MVALDRWILRSARPLTLVTSFTFRRLPGMRDKRADRTFFDRTNKTKSNDADRLLPSTQPHRAHVRTSFNQFERKATVSTSGPWLEQAHRRHNDRGGRSRTLLSRPRWRISGAGSVKEGGIRTRWCPRRRRRISPLNLGQYNTGL